MKRSKDEAATVAATVDDALPRIEIVGDRGRVHDDGFRAEVVAAATDPGARVPDVARRYGVCASLVYRWRRAASVGIASVEPVRLLPVRLTSAVEALPSGISSAPPPSAVAAARHAGLIEIELADGVRVRVDDGVSLVALRRVMSVLRG